MLKGNLISEGRTAEIFQWQQGKILKLFRSFMQKEAAKGEYAISLRISKQLTIVPKVYDFIEIENRCGIVYEQILGTSMMELISAQPWTVKREARRLAELHKLIHQEVDLHLPDCNSKLKEHISYTDLLTEDIKEKLYNYIDNLETKDMICHGDLHPDNVLITSEGSFVVDWMTAVKGNPLSDVARTSIMLKFAIISDKNFWEKKVIGFVRNILHRSYINHYVKISRIKLSEIEKWELPVAAARLIEGIPQEEKAELVQFINKKVQQLS